MCDFPARSRPPGDTALDGDAALPAETGGDLPRRGPGSARKMRAEGRSQALADPLPPRARPAASGLAGRIFQILPSAARALAPRRGCRATSGARCVRRAERASIPPAAGCWHRSRLRSRSRPPRTTRNSNVHRVASPRIDRRSPARDARREAGQDPQGGAPARPAQARPWFLRVVRPVGGARTDTSPMHPEQHVLT
jgi:hypothetical protein